MTILLYYYITTLLHYYITILLTILPVAMAMVCQISMKRKDFWLPESGFFIFVGFVSSAAPMPDCARELRRHFRANNTLVIRHARSAILLHLAKPESATSTHLEHFECTGMEF